MAPEEVIAMFKKLSVIAIVLVVALTASGCGKLQVTVIDANGIESEPVVIDLEKVCESDVVQCPDAPVADEPAADAPVADEPAADAPVADEPAADAPAEPEWVESFTLSPNAGDNFTVSYGDWEVVTNDIYSKGDRITPVTLTINNTSENDVVINANGNNWGRGIIVHSGDTLVYTGVAGEFRITLLRYMNQ